MSAITIEIDDDLRSELEACAARQHTSVDGLMKTVIREGLRVVGEPERKPFVQKTHSMGQPLMDITKANAIAAELEDEAILEKMARGK
jgi:hypothetical protein